MNLKEKVQYILEHKEPILVIGAGMSGIAVTRFFTAHGVPVRCAERQAEDIYHKNSRFAAEVSELSQAGAQFHFRVDGESIVPLADGVQLCVLSPGVALESAACGALKRRGLSLVSELELGIELLGAERSIVVTGSNGKSTVVSLIHHLLRAAGKKSLLCGNVGVPVVSFLGLEDSEPVQECIPVVEASSYQLETCTVLKPSIGVLLNISDNHLERHGTLERYHAIKAKMLERQTAGDFAILNADDPYVSRSMHTVESTVVPFSVRPDQGQAAYWMHIDPDDAVLRFSCDGEVERYDLRTTKLIGRHNRANLAAAIAAVRLSGLSQKDVERALPDFHPLEHRIEPLGVCEGLEWINDSKSTTVASSVAALSSVAETRPRSRILLLIGGQAKAGSWEPLVSEIKSQQTHRAVLPVCFGQDGRVIAHHLSASGIVYEAAKNLSEAVEKSRSLGRGGDVVLLSPGCASFDEFSDFEERGNVFKSLVGVRTTPAG